jgi:hypothetical protein
MHRLFIKTILGCSQSFCNDKSAERTVRTMTVTPHLQRLGKKGLANV